MSHTERAPGPSSRSIALLSTEKMRKLEDTGAPPAAVPRPVRPGDLIGRYEIRAVLGEGGMGQVFSAHDPELRRTLALKLVLPRSRAASSRDRTRLLREAQALAKLQHPNVVAIHDVGTDGEQVFIAMELVAGQTLGAWLESGPRPWRTVIDTFVTAGRGLVAAHEVGIVHRDFKPGNVVVGPDRVVVVDFGLACARWDDVPSGNGEPLNQGSVLDVNLTLTNERMGTPRYMAPEQHLGGAITPLADQFSFATSLWTSLYGAPPFSGATSAELLKSVREETPRTPDQRAIPPRIRTALVRALAFDPSARWPNLADLLAELGRDPAAAHPRRLATLALVVATIAIPLTFAAGRRDKLPTCAAPPSSLWSESARADVRTVFLSGRQPSEFDKVDAALRGRVAAVSAAREEACAATEIRHEQSPELMDRRMACISRARGQIAVFIDVLRTADPYTLESASAPANRVGDLADCENPSLLEPVVQPAHGPTKAAELADLERELARIEAIGSFGRLREALDAGPALLEKVRKTGDMRLLGRVLVELGYLGCDVGDLRVATDALYEAARAAAAVRDDLLATWAFVGLVRCVGVKNEDFRAGQALKEIAEAQLARVGAPPDLRARLYRQEGALARVAGDLAGAFAYSQLAHMTLVQLYGDESAEASQALAEVGLTMWMLGAYRGALGAYQRALPVLAVTRGPTHHKVATYLVNMGQAASDAGDLDTAVTALDRSLAIEGETTNAPGAAYALRYLAAIRERQGDLAAAEALAARASAATATVRRPDHPDFAFDDLVRSAIAVDRGQLDEAQALAARALTYPMAAYGSGHPAVGDALAMQALVARKRGDLGTAMALIDQALAVHIRALGPRHPRVNLDSLEKAEIRFAGKNLGGALTLLEEIVPRMATIHVQAAPELVAARILFSRALLEDGQPARAHEEAARAVAAVQSHRLRADLDSGARRAFRLSQPRPAQPLGQATRTNWRLSAAR